MTGLWWRRAQALAMGALVFAGLLSFGPAFAPAHGPELQPGYKLDAPIEGVSRPTVIAFAEDDDEHVFVAERNGRVKVFEGIFDPTPELALDITDEVHSIHDRGLLGMALDPDFPDEPYLYLSYPYDAPLGGEAPVHTTGAAGDDSCVPAGGGEPDCLASGRVSRFELDPATGEAVGGEEPLVEDWCQQFPVHSMGDLEFDAEGALLVSGGDGANFADFDYGQFAEEGTLCDDPENEGGSLRAQDIADGAADPVGYNGTIIRIDPETGEPWPSNPMIGNADAQIRRILAYGLRNPFRLAFRPGASPPELYIADVGSGWFDEVDRLVDPVNQSSPVANFGWPCFESDEPNPGFHTLAFEVPLPLCRTLYESRPGNLEPPYYAYPRTGEVFPGDECDPSSGAAISGLIFYELPAAPEPGAPEELEGSLLFSDAARGCLWQMPEGEFGAPTSVGMRNLVVPDHDEAGAFIPVNIEIGPDGAVYMPNFYADEISRLRFFPPSENQPPEAEIAAEPTFGLMNGEGKFPVEFDATGPSDVDEAGELTYEWDLDGDGEFEVGPAETSETYEEKENVTAQLRVVDSEGATDFDRVKLYPGDRPPENLVMEMPPVDPPLWTVDDKIALSGSASDPDEETSDEDEVRLDWDVILRHCPDHCHSHPLEHFADTATAEVTAPDHEYPSHLLVRLTATDNRGMSIEVQRELYPRSVDVRMESEPPGVELSIGEVKREAPFEHTLLAGGAATVSAPEKATIGGHPYAFVSWSDGGDRTHLIRRSEDDTLVARYTPFPLAIAQPLPVSPISWVRLRFATRPGGLPLRFGRRWQRAQFSRWLQPAQSRQVAAPKRLRRRGRLFTFSRWTHTRRRVTRVSAVRPRTYVAVFRSRPIVRDGQVQALSWRRRAR